MFPMNERTTRLRERAFRWKETQQHRIGQRLIPALRALGGGSHPSWTSLKSRMLVNIIEQSEPVIEEDELLVGYNYFGSDDEQWIEVSLPKPANGTKEKIRSYLEIGQIAPGEIEFTLNTLEHIDQMLPPTTDLTQRPDSILLAEQEGIFWCYGTPENHTVLGYEKVLQKGFEGLADEVRQRLVNLDPAEIEKHEFLKSLLAVSESAANLGRRYANKVREVQNQGADPQRTAELSRLAQVLDQVPAQPARTFYEAVQSLWFAHIINTWEDGINANSLGRLDQILYPYYRKDIDEGRLTREEAFDLLCCLWIKLYRDYDVQQSVVGGVTPQGQDGTNELSYLMLDVTQVLDFVRCLSVRLHKHSPPALIRRSLEIVSAGKGIPFFFNDEVMVPALVNSGIAVEDARDYAAIGCVEITIPGKANPHAVSNRINLLKCLELALNNGRSMVTGHVLGPATGEPEQMTCLEDVIRAYETQVEYFVHPMIQETLRLQAHYRQARPMPYKSLLTEGCLEKGRDFNDRGAKYDYHESMPMGIPNVADSLAAIQKFVFDEQKYSLVELVEELRLNYPHETIRQEMLRRAPKYGNDNDAVDTLAARVFRHYCDLMNTISQQYQVPFFAQPFTFLWLVEAGERTGATPDGRKQGENLAYSISPMQGRDTAGLTALINSLAKLPQRLAPGSTSAIVEIEPALFSDSNIGALEILLRTAVEKEVGQLQFNVVSVETLRKAQADPEHYQNLAVRVSGFSQRFCLLDHKLQEHIIARTKHGKL